MMKNADLKHAMKNVTLAGPSHEADEESSDEEYTGFRGYCHRWFKTNCDIIQILQMFAIIINILIIWLIFFSIFGDHFGPTSEPFVLLILFATAKALGMLVDLIHIPPILGMMLMGIILKNAGYVNLTRPYQIVCAILRKLTLLSILLPAAFSLDPTIMRQMCFVLMIVSFFPILLEIVVDCILAYFLLALPWLWSLLLGVVMCAAAPAIVIPCIFILEEKGYGNVNGVHTLANASCILITIISIIYFGLVYGLVTATNRDEMLRKLYEGPMEIIIGLVYGVGLGLIGWYIPHDIDVMYHCYRVFTVPKRYAYFLQYYVTSLRTLYISCCSLLALFGFNQLHYDFAGIIGNFTTAFFANFRWRMLGWQRYNPVRDNFKLAWRFFEPISFALIGIEVDFSRIKLYDLLIGTVIMLIGTIVRFIFTVFLIKWWGFSMKQTIYLALTYISKATVQAAIGPIAMDYARSIEDPVVTECAQKLLAVTVSSIVITSPLGVILMLNGGPHLLTKMTDEEYDNAHRRTGMMYLPQADKDVRDQARRLTATFKQMK